MRSTFDAGHEPHLRLIWGPGEGEHRERLIGCSTFETLLRAPGTVWILEAPGRRGLGPDSWRRVAPKTIRPGWGADPDWSVPAFPDPDSRAAEVCRRTWWRGLHAYLEHGGVPPEDNVGPEVGAIVYEAFARSCKTACTGGSFVVGVWGQQRLSREANEAIRSELLAFLFGLTVVCRTPRQSVRFSVGAFDDDMAARGMLAALTELLTGLVELGEGPTTIFVDADAGPVRDAVVRPAAIEHWPPVTFVERVGGAG